MVLTLYGHAFSPLTQKVLIALVETKMPYAFVHVDLLAGENKAPEHLANNPFGTIPYINDDGFVLFESAAIARYIAAKADSPLLPRGDLHGVALFEQAMSVEKSQFETAIQPLTSERVAKPLFTGVPPDEERVAVLVKTLETKVAAYETMLSKQSYLAGDALTLADLFHLPLGTYLAPQGFTWFEDKTLYPNIARWWAEISSRPTWKEVQLLVRELTPLYDASLKPYVPK